MEIKAPAVYYKINIKQCLVRVGLFFIFSTAFLHGYAQSVSLESDPDAIVSHGITVADRYSRLLGVDRDSIKNIQLYTLIDQFVTGTYKYDGSDKKRGDGSGLSYLIEKRVYGITIPRVTGLQASAIKFKAESELKEGDLVFFNFGGSKIINNVGIYLQNGYFVHANLNAVVLIQNLRNPDIHKFLYVCGSVSNSVNLSSVK